MALLSKETTTNLHPGNDNYVKDESRSTLLMSENLLGSSKMNSNKQELNQRRLFCKVRSSAKFTISLSLVLSLLNALALLSLFLALILKHDCLWATNKSLECESLEELWKRVDVLESQIKELRRAKLGFSDDQLESDQARPRPQSPEQRVRRGTQSLSKIHQIPNRPWTAAVQEEVNPVRSLHLVNLRNLLITDGQISDWTIDTRSVMSEHRLLSPQQFELIEQEAAILVKVDGLFLVYAQLCFESLPGESHEFEIRVAAENRNAVTVTVCAIVAPSSSNNNNNNNNNSSVDWLVDLSCHTSLIVSLSSGERVFVEVLHVGRRVNTSDGKSFFGIVKLA